MHPMVRARRLFSTTLVCAAVVLGISVLMGTGRAQSRPASAHTCSATDKQFIVTVHANMTQLGYWSDALVSGDATPAVVIKQARAEGRQVAATAPTDRSLAATRSLLQRMFVEYAAAVRAKALGQAPGPHVQKAYGLANNVRDLLVDAQPGLAGKGCDVASLLQA